MSMSAPSQKYTRFSKSLVISSIPPLLVAISPYVFYLYESFPVNESEWSTWLFTYKSQFYQSMYATAWTWMNKFVPLYLMILWFFTCKHWWYHIILIPIAMFLFQLFSVMNDDVKYIDEFEIYYIIPIMMIVIPIVYLIRIKIFDKVVYGIDLKEIEEELKRYEVKDKNQTTDINT